MNVHTLNPWAILVAAISAFPIGGIWYSLLFGNAWKRANGLTSEPPAANMGKVFGITWVLSLVMSLNLAMGSGGRLSGRFWLGDDGLRHRVVIRAPTHHLRSD
jgi:hypothetical protein